MTASTSPNLAQLLGAALDARLADVHVAMPARVQSYDSSEQSVSAQPLLKRRFVDAEGETQTETIPIVNGVPVVFPGSGVFSVTWPLSVGDTGLLIFSEASIDKWLSRGGEVDPLDDRRHALSDAVFVPGLRPFSDPVPAAGVHGTAMVISAPLIHAGGTSSLALDSSVDAIANRTAALEGFINTIMGPGTVTVGATSYGGTSILKGA